MSRKEKRIVRYVEEGSLLKLKSYLRKHPEVELNFSHGRKRRSPLHLACSLGDDAVVRLLLKKGADALQKDRNGDTPLHVAANRVLKHGKRAYDDLLVPLRNSCSIAMDTPNNAGVTPQDLLQWVKTDQFHKLPAEEGRANQPDPEREWREKLFGECQDEFFETFGQYDDDFLRDDADDEDFGGWADRIRREYSNKQRSQARRARAQRAAGSGGRRKESEDEVRERRELQARLEREHAEYLARAARKEEETRMGKRQRYEERCAATFQSSATSGDAPLGYADVPWPAPSGTVEDMVAVMLHGEDRSDPVAFRKLLRRQQALWHPDKFAQRCGTRLREGDRQRILDTVTALSQELNKLAQSIG